MARLPNLIVPGAQKSGTTSLARALELHPECTLARPKEPSFFCRAADLADLGRYEACFAHAGDERVVVDASTAYMVDPTVPGRIHDALGGDLRIVFILRHPVARALSAYWHLAKRGAEQRSVDEVFELTDDSLEAAVAEEAARLPGALAAGRIDTRELAPRYDDALWPFRYLANGAYLEPIRRWERVFGRERVRVVLLEELAAEPRAVFERLAGFLGLERPWPPEALGAVHNRTRIPRRGRLARGVRALGARPALRALRTRVPALASLYERALFARRPRASGELEARLCDLYRPAEAELAAHLGPGVARWWQRAERDQSGRRAAA